MHIALTGTSGKGDGPVMEFGCSFRPCSKSKDTASVTCPQSSERSQISQETQVVHSYS